MSAQKVSMHNMHDESTKKVWLSDKRYYSAEIKTDILGNLVFERNYSGRWQKRVRVLTEPLCSFEEGLRRMEETHKRRLAHGYALV